MVYTYSLFSGEFPHLTPQAVPVGRPGSYLNRPGFWHGTAGVAACWLRGARSVDAAIAAAEAMLVVTACRVDADPADRTGTAERDAPSGPAPLALDGPHARRVADLTMYVRQSHAEADLAALGRLAADGRR